MSVSTSGQVVTVSGDFLTVSPTVLRVNLLDGDNSVERGFTSVQTAFDYAFANNAINVKWQIVLDLGNNGALSIADNHDAFLQQVFITGKGRGSIISLTTNSGNAATALYIADCSISSFYIGNPDSVSQTVAYFLDNCYVSGVDRASASTSDTQRTVTFTGRSTYSYIHLGGAVGATGAKGQDVSYYQDTSLANGGGGGNGQEAYNVTIVNGVLVTGDLNADGGAGGGGGGRWT